MLFFSYAWEIKITLNGENSSFIHERIQTDEFIELFHRMVNY